MAELDEKAIAEQQLKDINEDFADIAEAILRVSQLGDLIDKSSLKKDTVVMLLAKKAHVHLYEAKQVLDAIPHLKDYLK